MNCFFFGGFSIVFGVKKLKMLNVLILFQWNVFEVFLLVLQGVFYIMIYFLVFKNKKELGVIGYIFIDSDDGNSDIDDSEVSSKCI